MRRILILIILSAFLASCASLGKYRELPEVKAWESEIEKFEQLDVAKSYPSDAVMFAGSSSIRLWSTIGKDMLPYNVIQRGYGGAKLSDFAVYADRILYPHPCQATVAVEEIVYGDNDSLSAIVARLVKADELYILSDIDGLYNSDPRKNPSAKRISRVREITPELHAMTSGAGSELGTGGMETKIRAAQIATQAGITTWIINGTPANNLYHALEGQDIGTVFEGKNKMLEAMGKKAKDAGIALALSTHESRNKALLLISEKLRTDQETLLQANEKDLKNASDLSPHMRDRLMLNPIRLSDIARALEEIAALPDPLGKTLFEDTRPNNLHIRRMSVPLGVIAVIYEARPNVTLDAAAMCIKSGNAVILRGGKEAIHSNTALTKLAQDACREAGLSGDCVQLVADTSRKSALALMKLRESVDLLIPRGGHALIQSALENATIPVLQTGEGVCHVYIDKTADLNMAQDIIVNAKCSRPSVCNAAECLLVHREIAVQALPQIAKTLIEKGVELRGDETTVQLVKEAIPAKDTDWGYEFNDLILAVRVVGSLDEALTHIARYGTGHSEAIVTDDPAAAQRFLSEVDAAAVYHNASTRFTDGGEFGFGAEIGISTQKLHCRGPVDIKALTSTKYIIHGQGQTR